MEKTIKSKKYRKLINYMTDVRNKANITQIELAKRIEKPQSFISKYERLERVLDINEMFDILNALGVSDKEIARTIVKVRNEFK